MTKRTTIKDVAKASNVSIATVSRVLNDNAFVTEDIKKAVFKAVKDLNYIPNTAAKSLKTQKSGIIGFVISDISSKALVQAAKATEEVIAESNYNIILCTTENDPVREKKYLQMLMSKNVDGIVINTTGKNSDYIVSLSKQIPIVLLNRNIESEQFRGDLVDSNNFEVSYQLTKQLLTLGHRRILAICGPEYLSNAKERYEGFRSAMAECGVDVTKDYPYIFSGNFSRQTGIDAINYMMSLTPRPTAIISLNITMSIGALTQCHALNLHIPEEVSFISYDGIPNSELMIIRPTSAKFNIPDMGRQIGKAMLERIKNPKMASRRFIFNPDIVLGNSLSLPNTDFSEK